MSLTFRNVSKTMEVDGPDGWLYRTVTTLDFHQGWFTRLLRTTRADNGYPRWTHGVHTQSLTTLGDWAPQCVARPIMKFPTFEAAAVWLDEQFERYGKTPCQSPYCECEPGKCSNSEMYDARGITIKVNGQRSKDDHPVKAGDVIHVLGANVASLFIAIEPSTVAHIRNNL